MINYNTSKNALFWLLKSMQSSQKRLIKNNNRCKKQTYLDRILYNLKKNIYSNYNKKSHFAKFYLKFLKY